MSKFTALLGKFITGNDSGAVARAPLKKVTNRDLIRMESKIGALLFGPIPKGHRREFFCLDEHTWIWYEEWHDAQGKPASITTRYEIQPNGILKVQDGQPYQVVEGEELHNFAMATRLYREQVIRGVYHRDPITGQPLPVAGK
ncbi:MAG TPA: hypothetical protein VFO38_02810 [Candidatus Saccharimonadales bacterium]|nr:hypothetical protein [Candidatus Saccharimonadales bacterium]